MISIFPLEEKYVEETAALDRRIFPSSPWGAETFRNNLRNDYDHPVIALEEDRVAGYGILRQIDAGEILLIGVAPELRRRGIGKQLLEALLSEANRGENIFLEVREGNLAARKLYESAGFTEIARRHGYYRDPAEDAVIMML